MDRREQRERRVSLVLMDYQDCLVRLVATVCLGSREKLVILDSLDLGDPLASLVHLAILVSAQEDRREKLATRVRPARAVRRARNRLLVTPL